MNVPIVRYPNSFLAFIAGRDNSPLCRRTRRLSQSKTELAVRAKHKEYQISMEYVAAMKLQCEVRGQSLALATFRAFRHPDRAPEGGWVIADQEAMRVRDAWVSFRKHMLTADNFWSEVIKLFESGELPPTFFQGGWFYRADNYRQLMEPLFIANWYRAGFYKASKPYLRSEGHNCGRHAEFEFIEGRAREKYGAAGVVSSTDFAMQMDQHLADRRDLVQCGDVVFGASES
jgi:Enhanced disease susceptibility 1 protein EP domain